MKNFNKKIPTSFGKSAGSGTEITPEMLARINTFTLADIPADQLYVRKMLLAHNAIDRDNERFSEKVLADFASTLPGKSLLIGHEWGPPGVGTFFQAEIQKMDLQTAKENTGEDIRLPDGIAEFQALYAWFYTVKTPSKADLLADIDAGVVRHTSIGFRSSNLVRVSNKTSGETLYYEYKGPAEAREGSLVWLGAQPGATITKSLRDGVDIEDKDNQRGNIKMKTILEKLGLAPDATEDQAGKALNQKLARLKGLEEVVEPLGESATKAAVDDLMNAAEDGKAYRKDLVEKQVRFERLLGRVGDQPKDAEERTRQLIKRDIADIKGDVSFLEKQVREKFPDKLAIEGGDGSGSRNGKDAGGEAKYNFRKKS